MAANYKSIHVFVVFTLLALAPLITEARPLNISFYDESCPKAQEIVRRVVAKAVKNETRMAASLIRLHFHDCFAQGCDASILLSNATHIVSEKVSNPNRNSVRGFNVIDEIKEALEDSCPNNVSCADILALAARDSAFLVGGPYWDVPLGRLDSRNANLNASNNDIPAPNSTFQNILQKFQAQGLDVTDLVALSGSHTVGKARCVSLRQRLYNGSTQASLDKSYGDDLRIECPSSGARDDHKIDLDPETPEKFDNSYFKNLLSDKGLLNSDQVLTNDSKSYELVKKYAENSKLFFDQFALSMVKMGNINSKMSGEIRKYCRKINDE